MRGPKGDAKIPAGHSKNFSLELGSGELLLHQGERLFEILPDIVFFVKDHLRRFAGGNRALVEALGASSMKEVIGRTDLDFLPGHLADFYARDDQKVLSSGIQIVNKVELAPWGGNLARWSMTTKLPLHSPTGEIRGLVGITRSFELSADGGRHSEWTGILEWMQRSYANRITVGDMAARMHLSVSAFERRFKKSFLMLPSAYLRTVRILAACRTLAKKNTPLVQIASDCGFSDQSHFSREFKRAMRMTPMEYRQRHV